MNDDENSIESVDICRFSPKLVGGSLLWWMEAYSHHLVESDIDELIDGQDLKKIVHTEFMNLFLMELAFHGIAKRLGCGDSKECAKNECLLCAALKTLFWCEKRVGILIRASDLHDAASVNVVFRSIGEVLSPMRNEKLKASFERAVENHGQKNDGS